jgi:hypothetical protein
MKSQKRKVRDLKNQLDAKTAQNQELKKRYADRGSSLVLDEAAQSIVDDFGSTATMKKKLEKILKSVQLDNKRKFETSHDSSAKKARISEQKLCWRDVRYVLEAAQKQCLVDLQEASAK